MGWLFMSRHSMGYPTPKSNLDAQFTYDHRQKDGSSQGLKVIASSCPQNRVYCVAAQVMTDGIGGEFRHRLPRTLKSAKQGRPSVRL